MIPRARLDTPHGEDMWLPPICATRCLAVVMEVTLCSKSYEFAPTIDHAPAWNTALHPLCFFVYVKLESPHWIHPPTNSAFWNTIDQCIKEQHHEMKLDKWFMDGELIRFSAIRGFEYEWILVDYPIYYWAPACVFSLRRSKLVHVPTGK